MPINDGFLNHGIFLESAPIVSLSRYARYKNPLPQNATITALVDRFIEAVKDLNMSSAWVQLFNRKGDLDTDGRGATKELVAGLKAAGIKIVAWGYCHSTHSSRDIDLANRLCLNYGIDAFVADVEPGNEINGRKDNWNKGDFVALMTGLNARFKTNNLGISTFAHMARHPDACEIMKLATSLVCMYVPQIYWNKRDPISYAKNSISSWAEAGITTPLVATVQSYWEVGEGTPGQADMEQKVAEFLKGFPETLWSKIIGLNWYHAGNKNTTKMGGMSDSMITAIANGKLDKKPYKHP